MAVNALSLAECLRPWRNAGLFHILGEAAARNSPFFSWEEDGAHPPPRDCRLSPSPARAPDAAKRPERQHPAAVAASGQAPKPAPQERRKPPQPEAAPGAARPASATNNQLRGDESSPGHAITHWPGAWQRLFARTKAAPLIWTYPELGEDLSGQGSPERSAFLRSLLGDLRLPRGSSAFWPLRLAGESGDEPSEAPHTIFQDGLFRLRPKILIMLGPRSVALSGLPLNIKHPFTQEITHGLLTVLLPDFSSLLSNAPQAESALTFLRTALSGMPLSAG